LREAWHVHPGFRLMQFLMSTLDKPDDAAGLWHTEDDTVEKRLRMVIKGRAARQKATELLKLPNHVPKTALPSVTPAAENQAEEPSRRGHVLGFRVDGSAA
jgi:polysaccharide deacetylase 2 family uncharacterized protein YibQ